MPAAFITFEGPEGSGKTTQASKLAQAFDDHGLKTKLTREPGGDPISEEIRKILLDGSDHAMANRTELLLYLAARAQHTERIIIPNLKEECIVVCARYADSTTAYQGYGAGLDIGLIEAMNNFATYGLKPDLTFLIDIDVEVGLRRQQHWNRMERKTLDFHQRVRQGFLTLAELHPERIVVIDGSLDIDVIHQQILQSVRDRLGVNIISDQG